MDPDERQKGLESELVSGWTGLSAVDMSIVNQAQVSGNQVLTTAETSHWLFWIQLVRLGWAEEVELAAPLVNLQVKLTSFRLTDAGKVGLPVLLRVKSPSA